MIELVFGVLIGLLILIVLVVVHELGHAIIAKRNGVVVEEFGVGFPPRAFARKLKNGVLLSFNWLPLGGFVKLQGEHDAANKKGDYGAVSFLVKTKILFAGVLMNWCVAAILLTVLAWTGLPKVLPNQFTIPSDTVFVKQPVELTDVAKGSPAEVAGLKAGDQIMRFAGNSVSDSVSLTAQAQQDKGKDVEVVYLRKGVEYTTNVKLKAENSNHQGYLGVASGQREEIRTTWSAPIVGIATTGQFTFVTLRGLGDLVVNLTKGIILQFSPNVVTREQAHQELVTVSQGVAGPIGILGTIFPAAEQAGLTQIIFLTAIISLTLAVMNTLPIPALDGGRWFVTALFRIRRKPLTKEREERIQGAGFLVLMVLVIIVTVADVSKLFK